jgi:murein DD-endopeptidase MepM/ murein hydrolase activator NlpD
MSLLTYRGFLLAWSFRKPLALGCLGLIGVPLLFAAMLTAGAGAGAAAGVGTLGVPVHGSVLTQPFGCTSYEREPWSEQCPGHHFHSGIDLAASLKTPVFAATPGTAVVARERGGYGLYIVILRDAGFSTLYAHLYFPLVGSGGPVVAGQVIGLMGSSGNSSGPHLHFEVRLGGVPVDPLPLLPAGGWGGDARG